MLASGLAIDSLSAVRNWLRDTVSTAESSALGILPKEALSKGTAK
jgi:hypothetical protein